MSLLTVDRLTKDFGGLRALNQFDMAVETGELVGLVGPNGAGKTTLFNVVCGNSQPTSGKILFENDDITGLQPHQIASKGIARTFQLTNLFHDVTVLENVLFGLHRSVEAPLWRGLLEAIFQGRRFENKERMARQKAEEILEFFELRKSRDLPASNLPHVDQRKMEIAIALATNPKLLLVDEAAEGMQIEEAKKLSDTLKILRDRGITILVVDHNMKFMMRVCERIVVMHYGVKIAEGTPQEISANEKVRKVYLG